MCNYFEYIQADLSNPLLLKHFEQGLETRIYTDASNKTIGAIIIQVKDGIAFFIQYLSKRLPETKKVYPLVKRNFVASCTRASHGDHLYSDRKLKFSQITARS